jgi:hypothetical protein
MPKSKFEHIRRRTISDPLSAALLPPTNESPIERDLRLKAEIDAKKVSDNIDEMIRQERNEQKKSKAEVNVLLLGQSESGKSTTLKRKFPRSHPPRRRAVSMPVVVVSFSRWTMLLSPTSIW